MDGEDSLPLFSHITYFLKSFFRLCVGASFFFAFAVLVGYYWLTTTLPPLQKFDARVRSPSVTIQAIDGTVLATYGDSFEEFLAAEDLPPFVPNAFLSVEDRRFYEHNGVDFLGVLRAAWRNFHAHRVVQGGSTLTQQLAKNMLMASGRFPITDRSLMRKLQEFILTLKIESYFSKPEILTLYLNRVYFGAGTYGIDAASRRYFHKSARELTLFEAAILAGILRAPSRYSPLANPQRACSRANLVLTAMEKAGFIGPKWRDEWPEWQQNFLASVRDIEKGSRYFADWVFETIPSIIGPIDQDLTVVTTLHTGLQHKTEEVLKKFHKEFGAEYKFSQAASIIMTPSGAVLAMVGGLDYGRSQFNRATSAMRQPGSAFKTFVYLTALEEGYDLDDKFDDSPYEQGEWKPGNYKWKTQGEISLLDAYVYSVNSVCIRLAKEVGIRKVIKIARRLGISSPLQANLTLSLGSSELTFLELIRAYAPFFNYGYACYPYGIYEIRNKSGEILYQKSEDRPIRIIEDDVLTKMKIMMRQVIARGTGRAANVDPYIAGKTGSNGNRDAWFFWGRDPMVDNDKASWNESSLRYIVDREGMVGCVWIGNDSTDLTMAPYSTGGRIPTRIGGELNKFILSEKPYIEEKSRNSAGEIRETKVEEDGDSGHVIQQTQFMSMDQLLQVETESEANKDKNEEGTPTISVENLRKTEEQVYSSLRDFDIPAQG